MSKGITPKIKKSTISKDAKINKAKQTIKKDLKLKERNETWSRRIQNATKEKIIQEKITKSNPLNYLDPINEQLENIDVKPTVSVRPDILNPHLKRVVSNRGRKQALKKEQDQFMKVMNHSAFLSNPLDAIGKHLTNTINHIKSLPKKK